EGIGFEPAGLDDRSKGGEVGWGLFSIRERVALLGGRLDVDSAPGKGTRFRLIAPRSAARDAAAAADPSGLAPIGPAPAGGADVASEQSLRILLVDDHAAVRRALREMLQERPQLQVVGDASNGFEAIAFAHTLRPDVVLMDVSMPHMDGIEATRRWRGERPSVEIVGLSMQPRPPGAHAIEEAGAAAYFVKGIDSERLIAHLLRIHRLATARAGSSRRFRQPLGQVPTRHTK